MGGLLTPKSQNKGSLLIKQFQPHPTPLRLVLVFPKEILLVVNLLWHCPTVPEPSNPSGHKHQYCAYTK